MRNGQPGMGSGCQAGGFREGDGAPASVTCGAATTAPVARFSSDRPGPELRDLVQISTGFDTARSPRASYALLVVDDTGVRTRTEVGGDLEAALQLLMRLGCPLRHAAWVRRGAALRLDRDRDGGWQVTRYGPGPAQTAVDPAAGPRRDRRGRGHGDGTGPPAPPTRAVPTGASGRSR